MFVELERKKLRSRLAIAWAACALPRAAFAYFAGLGEDYGFFVHGRTDAAWYPLYDALAGFLWSATGGHVGPYFAVHLALHAALGPVVYALGSKLGLGARSAWLAVLGVALMPYYVSTSARQPQVGITIVVVAALVLTFAAWAQDLRSIRLGSLFAAWSALTVTLRPNAVSTIGAFYLLALARPPGPRAVGRAPAALWISGAVFAAALSGLAAFNLERHGRFSPFSENVGFNLYVGNNPRVGEYLRRYDITSLQDSLGTGLPPAVAAAPVRERDRILLRLALDYIAAHPGRAVWMGMLKSWRYWDLRLEDARLNPIHWNLAYSIPYVGYGLLALGGAWISWKRGPRWALAVIGTGVLSYWLPHAVFFGTVRMRMTMEFLLILLAARAVRCP